MKTAIILGSSRTNGNTGQLSQHISNEIAADLFDLSLFNIKPYDYDANYNDDFTRLMNQLLSYERIILATPMYWYSASAQMKTFLDRISDLLSIEKNKGRELRGKFGALIATGGDKTPPNCFEDVFKMTFKYLGINYQGMAYCECADTIKINEHEIDIQRFIDKLKMSAHNDKKRIN